MFTNEYIVYYRLNIWDLNSFIGIFNTDFE